VRRVPKTRLPELGEVTLTAPQDTRPTRLSRMRGVVASVRTSLGQLSVPEQRGTGTAGGHRVERRYRVSAPALRCPPTLIGRQLIATGPSAMIAACSIRPSILFALYARRGLPAGGRITASGRPWRGEGANGA
jgi:hypothetical protein